MFRVENLIVKDVLAIEQLTLLDSVITIEGQSGSGKSTLLRLLNNLDEPTSGTIYFKEKSLTHMAPQQLRKRIVMVPQNPVIFDGTIQHNLLIGNMFSGGPLAENKQLEQMLDLLWLDKSLEEDANDLSGGERQRVALGRVLLMKQAEVYLLDEPSSELDDKTRDHVIKEFIQVAQQQSKQVIMVTHDHHITENFAEKVIHMDSFSKKQFNGVGEK